MYVCFSIFVTENSIALNNDRGCLHQQRKNDYTITSGWTTFFRLVLFPGTVERCKSKGSSFLSVRLIEWIHVRLGSSLLLVYFYGYGSMCMCSRSNWEGKNIYEKRMSPGFLSGRLSSMGMRKKKEAREDRVGLGLRTANDPLVHRAMHLLQINFLLGLWLAHSVQSDGTTGDEALCLASLSHSLSLSVRGPFCLLRRSFIGTFFFIFVSMV